MVAVATVSNLYWQVGAVIKGCWCCRRSSGRLLPLIGEPGRPGPGVGGQWDAGDTGLLAAPRARRAGPWPAREAAPHTARRHQEACDKAP